MYEHLERLAQLPATRVCAPFVLGGLLFLFALSSEPHKALQAGGLVSLLAAIVLIRDAGGLADAEDDAGRLLQRHFLGAALHAALFAMSFLLAAVGMSLAGVAS